VSHLPLLSSLNDVNSGAKFDVYPIAEAPIPDALKEKAAEYRAEMIELAVEQDEEALTEYLDGIMPSYEKLKACIRKGTLNFSFVPIVTGMMMMIL